jgi:alpha-1,3-mannosyltransferase
MCSAEFFVSASEYEGFGITALEAMAAGCIPILNNIDSFREFVKNGKNGFIADFTDSKKASESILNAMNINKKEKTEIAKRAIERAEGFSWDKKARGYEKVFLEVKK